MKMIFAILIGLASISAQAQNSGIHQLASDANHLVQNYGHLIPQQDRERVRYDLQNVLQTFARNGIYPTLPPPPPPPPSRNITCDSGNNALVDLDRNGRMIYDFASMPNCLEARDFVLINEPFCDYSSNTLNKEDRGMIHDFSSADNCREARPRVAVGKNYCDYSNNALYSSTGQMIYDFSSAEDCRRAMN